jgi:hypothetical protein
LQAVKQSPILWPQVYLSVALTTAATLLLELSLTRIFSVVFYYHMAFLAISIALFGLGAGGVFSYVVAGWKAPLFSKLGKLSAVNSLFVVLSLVVVLAQKTNPGNWALALVYFTTAGLLFRSAGCGRRVPAPDSVAARIRWRQHRPWRRDYLRRRGGHLAQHGGFGKGTRRFGCPGPGAGRVSCLQPAKPPH